MGIVYNTLGYISKPEWPEIVSPRRILRGLTPRNVEFLKKLGFLVNRGGKSK